MATACIEMHKLPTGIPGFDIITQGGLPKTRTTLIAGTAGSAKTVFAAQFLAEGIRQYDQNGVFVTFEESSDDIRLNMTGFGWEIRRWEEEGRWTFVDASPEPGAEQVEVGKYDLGALLARIENAVQRVGAQRVALDSLGAIFTQFTDSATVRRELFRIAKALKRMQVTSVMTVERTDEYGVITRFGVEEFVADNAIILRNALDAERRRRTIEILKFRGAPHEKGECPFTIIPQQGIVSIPLSGIELKQRSSSLRISSGVDTLDQMCGGGFFRDSIVLVSGATGTGKTLLATQFLHAGAANGSRSLLLAFEESRDQLFRNANGWGFHFEQLESCGTLKVCCEYPEVTSLEDHLIRIKSLIDEFQPERVAIDSLSALKRVSSTKTFREFVIGLISYLKHREVAALFTAATPSLLGGPSLTDAHISTITDTIILLRYVEIYGEMRRGATVLKMRGSRHDRDIREFTIDTGGMRIGRTFRNVTGIIKGDPVHSSTDISDRLGTMFQDDLSTLDGQDLHESDGELH